MSYSIDLPVINTSILINITVNWDREAEDK